MAGKAGGGRVRSQNFEAPATPRSVTRGQILRAPRLRRRQRLHADGWPRSTANRSGPRQRRPVGPRIDEQEIRCRRGRGREALAPSRMMHP